MFICPVCGEALIKSDNQFSCRSGHCFDIAKQGYVNLLRSQKSSAKHHGDDKTMVLARKNFLEKGFYSPLADALCKAVLKYAANPVSVLDAGCGEGWYCSKICESLKCADICTVFTGIDISKDAIKLACRNCTGGFFAVASVFNIPVADSSQDIVLNIFSPSADDEYRRIIKKGGMLIRVVPLERHLFSLKEKIYDSAILNPPVTTSLDGFALKENINVCYELTLSSNEDIMNLFKMTPYYYKTGRKDQEKAEKLTYLKTDIQFGILIYQKL